MHTTTAQVIEFAQAARRQRKERQEEWHLTSEEVCPFVAHHIKASKLTYSAIAGQAQCSPQTVSNIAAGETRFPRYATVVNILVTLGFEVVVR
jgi:hypothetical protein